MFRFRRMSIEHHPQTEREEMSRHKRRQTELSKKLTALNRSYDLLWQAHEGLRDRQLEVERRMLKLEALLGVEWQSQRGWFDGEYVERTETPTPNAEHTGPARWVKVGGGRMRRQWGL